jgi:hypothetical protein
MLEAEEKLGFRLPPLLRRFYREVSNGEFGPGAGLLTLDGPWMDGYNDYENESLVAYYRINHSEHAAIVLPEKLVHFSGWGCAIYSCVDCAQPECPVWRNDNNTSHCVYALEAPSLHEWFESWLTGEMSSHFDWDQARQVRFECHVVDCGYPCSSLVHLSPGAYPQWRNHP